MNTNRLATLGHGAVIALTQQVRRGAVMNACTAAAVISLQVADRQRLAPNDVDSAPGGLSPLSGEECLALLATRTIGRFVYVARAGVPDVVPVNYVLDGSNILVRSGVGPKLQAAERRAVVAFEVDDIDEDTHSGWSVVVVGPTRRLTTAQQHELPEGVLPFAWANGPRNAVIHLRPTRIEGRRLR